MWDVSPNAENEKGKSLRDNGGVNRGGRDAIKEGSGASRGWLMLEAMSRTIDLESAGRVPEYHDYHDAPDTSEGMMARSRRWRWGDESNERLNNEMGLVTRWDRGRGSTAESNIHFIPPPTNKISRCQPHFGPPDEPDSSRR